VSPLAATVVLLAGYLLGSVSFAVLWARGRGVDIFAEGSGNPGATNVKRVLGAKQGNAVFAMDALKGLVAAGWPLLAFGGDVALGVLGLAGAILGHSYSVFLRFRGGKGVATSMGGLAALMPLVLVSGLAVWGLVYAVVRVVAAASIAFALALPLAAWALSVSGERLALAFALAALIALRHRSNLARMARGDEPAFKK